MNWNSDKVNNIFNGAIALASLCLVIVTLFQVTDKSATYIVDNCFSFTAGLYLVSVVFAYLSCLRKENKKIEQKATLLFSIALIATFLSTAVMISEFFYYA